MKRVFRSLFILAAGIAIGVAGVMTLRPPVATTSGQPFAVPPIDAALDIVLADVHIVDVPFEQAVRQIAERTGVAIQFDSTTLQSAGVDLAKPVSLRGRNVLLADVLDDLTGSASGSTVGEQVIWWVRETRIVITTEIGLPVATGLDVTRAYDIRDLLDSRQSPLYAGFEGPKETPPSEEQRQTAIENLTYLLQLLLPSDPTGRTVAGSTGAIRELGGWLLIAHSPARHRDVRMFLKSLRGANGIQLDVPPPPEAFRWFAGQWVSSSNEMTEAKMRGAIDEFEASGPMWQAVEKLAKQIGVVQTFSPHVWRHCLDATINVRFRATSANDVLRAILDQAANHRPSADGEARPLGWWLEGEVVVVGRQLDADEHRVTRVYDLRSWLVTEWAVRPPTTQPVDPDVDRYEPLFSKLYDLISAQWGRSGSGPDIGIDTGTIRGIGGFLVVTHTPEMQEKLRKHLQALRAIVK